MFFENFIFEKKILFDYFHSLKNKIAKSFDALLELFRETPSYLWFCYLIDIEPDILMKACLFVAMIFSLLGLTRLSSHKIFGPIILSYLWVTYLSFVIILKIIYKL